MEMVVDKYIDELNQQLARKHIAVTITERARTWFALKGHNPRYGARPLGRLVQKEINDALSEEILFGKTAEGRHS